MDEQKIEELLYKAGNKIPVDQKLKAELRQSFEGKKPAGVRFRRSYIAAACIALAILVAGMSFWFATYDDVQADALWVQNYRTYMEIESNYDLSVAEYKGILYVPDIHEGIFRYDGKARQKVYSGKVSLVRISPDGKNLVFFEEGNIGVLNLASQKSEIVLRSGNGTVYEDPAWMDDNTILFTRQELVGATDYNPERSGIYKLNLTSGEQVKLAAGSKGSYSKNGNMLAYQKGDKIAALNLSNKQEVIVDGGMQPAISPDGKKIAYTKLDITYEGIEENVKIERVLQNLWIADGEDFGRKTRITSNIVLEDINPAEWLKSLKPSNELQMLSLGGRYGYQFPAWSNAGSSIYVLRRDFTNNKAVVVRIDLGKETLSAKEVTDRFLQSAKLGDEDYQSSLSAVRLGRITSYSILDGGREGAKVYNDAEITTSDTDGAAPKTSKLRLYMTRQNGQLMVTEIKEQ